MKMKRIVAGVAAFILIGGLLTFANGLVGNPISKMIVNIAAKNYVNQTYPDLDMKLDKAGYNLKSESYIVKASSKTSIDTYFSIEFTGTGKLYRDNYEEEVTSKSNTWWRVGQEYNKLIADGIKEGFPYESAHCYGSLLEKEDGLGWLELDKNYDIRELAKQRGNLDVIIDSETVDVQHITKTIWDTKNFMDQKDIPFYSIDVTLRTPYMGEEISEESMEVRKFSYQDIREDGLSERVQQNMDAMRAYNEEMDKEKI